MFKALLYYLRVDYKARFRNNMICVAIATTLYLLSSARYTEVVAVKVSLAALVVSYTISTLYYVFRYITATDSLRQVSLTWDAHASLSFLWVAPRKTSQMSRRRLLGSMGWLIALAFAGLGTPLLEAYVVDERLRKVVEGRPNAEKISEVTQIITEIREHNLRASPELVVDAANQFATYQSSIQALPLNVVLLTTLTFRPEHGVPYMLNVGCTQGREGGKAHLSVFGSGDSGFGSNMALGNCSDFVVWPEGEPKVLLLDNIDGENATYLKCILSYGGGRLKIKNVRFVDCTFQISSAYASNRNVLQFLTEAMTGLPISLDLTP